MHELEFDQEVYNDLKDIERKRMLEDPDYWNPLPHDFSLLRLTEVVEMDGKLLSAKLDGCPLCEYTLNYISNTFEVTKLISDDQRLLC